MNNIPKLKHRIKVISLILIILLTGTYTIVSMSFFDSLSNVNKVENENDLVDNPKTGGTHVWWDLDFRSRQAINITNPYNVPLNNFTTNIEFNYTTLVDSDRMNSSLRDIRIVEYDDLGVPHLRKYYYQKDYPSTNLVTVWFDTNIPADTSQSDTYLYYGNDNVWPDEAYFMNESSSLKAKNFGWIRNGDFELDYKSDTEVFNVFGWNFSTDVPNNVFSTGYSPRTGAIDAGSQHNLSTSDDYQERTFDSYSFKWGDKDHYIVDNDEPTDGHDYVGSLYSYPFIVPTVTGADTGEIYLEAYRNFRVYDYKAGEDVGFFAVISKAYNPYFDGTLQDPNFDYFDHWLSIGKNTGTPSERKPTYAIDKLNGDAEGNTIIDTTSDGAATGWVTIDVSEYQGQLITLQFGLYPLSSEIIDIATFGQVDEIKFTYELTTELEAVEEVMSVVSVIVKDVDGRIVPGAKVSLANNSAEYLAAHQNNPIVDTEFSGENNGTAYFTSVGYDTYDIWVNYTIPYTNNETVVYNSTGVKSWKIDQATRIIKVEVDIWTIDFEIVDYGEEPMNSGYIEINYTKGGALLDNLTLDSNGKATFRWKKHSRYYYKVYYRNVDYNIFTTTALNESYISRSDYEQNKLNPHTFLINQTNLNGTGMPKFSVYQRIYTNGSLNELGNKKIINATINITLTEDSSFDKVQVFYIDKDNSTYGNLIYEKAEGYGIDLSSEFEIEIRSPPIISANLEGDSYEAYGLYVKVFGSNSSTCNGIIDIKLTETCNIYNVTDLCKVNITIIDSTGTGWPNCWVKVNGTINTRMDFKVDLYTDPTGRAYGYPTNTDLPLWYLKGYPFNFSLNFGGEHRYLIVNKSDQYKHHGNPIYYYNYSVEQPADLIFEIYFTSGANLSWFQTRFEKYSGPESLIWSQNATIQVNFTSTDDNWVSSEPVSLPANAYCYIKTTGSGSYIVKEYSMKSKGQGIFEVSFNSSQLSAGERGVLYSIIISGSKLGYSTPPNLSDSIFIDTFPTNISMHDYYDSFNEIIEFSQTFGEFVNLSIKYSNLYTKVSLKAAILTYEWLNLDPVQFYEDPFNDGYYTATIDTSIAETWGLKSIKIIAKLENFTTQTLITSLSITERPTTLNGETDLVYTSSKVWVEDPNPFEFQYYDVIGNEIVGNLTTATYIWEKLYPNGTRIPGIHGTGTLVQNENKTYILDFNTELKPVGYYYLYLTLQKQNYEAKSALINLEIMLRNFTTTLDATGLGDNNQIKVDQGDDIDFEITLWDETRNVDLENASVTLTIRGVEYVLQETASGVYGLTFRTNDIDVFITSKTLSGKITIQAANFTTEEIIITVVVQMEEIFPGMPTFYFILITASIIGVVGSLVAYRVIQQARIPKHVKKIRKVKGYIKSKKNITEAISIPTKEKMIAKLIGDDWKDIGLSIEEILGIEELKPKKPPIKDTRYKEGGEID